MITTKSLGFCFKQGKKIFCYVRGGKQTPVYSRIIHALFIAQSLTPIEMKVTAEKNEKVANMIFASIYPLYLNRLEKNGRTKEELNQVIEWFTGFKKDALQVLIEQKVTFRTFFQKAKIHPNAHLIKGVVCGYRIEEIEDEFELYKQCRRMEKLIDELARGRKMEKILREEKK